MASLWQKTLFYLGLVDDDEAEGPEEAGVPNQQSRVRTVDPPRRPATRPETVTRTDATVRREVSRPSPEVAGRRVEPPDRQRRRISQDPEHAEAGVILRPGGGSSPLPAIDRGESEIIVARTFSDAQTLADHIRDGRAVVLDLRSAESAMVRRLVDFASGLTYGLEGKMVKTIQGVILVTPAGVSIGLDEKQRLASMGLYSVASA